MEEEAGSDKGITTIPKLVGATRLIVMHLIIRVPEDFMVVEGVGVGSILCRNRHLYRKGMEVALAEGIIAVLDRRTSRIVGVEWDNRAGEEITTGGETILGVMSII